ncbi:MAG: DUF5107 domain-containing protein [Clostridiales bacterium]|nr:DUF5107 domain-containing protein [Clostridiales bacterium]
MRSKNCVDAYREQLKIPTYLVDKPEKMPMFFELRNNQGTRGNIYPLPMTDKITDEKVVKTYDAIKIENKYIKTIVLPELGGRIYEGFDKVNNYNFVYHNNVIKPQLIGLCGPWISGGIEFNWPQHHRPTTFMPVDSTIEQNPDGSKTVWVGEIEPLYGTKGMAGITIYPDRSYLQAKIKIYNRTPYVQTFHWWSNLAVHVNDDYRVIFPSDIDYITYHNKLNVSEFPEVKGIFAGIDFGSGTDITWYKNIHAPASFFIFNSNYDFMAGYDYSKNSGTVHIADRNTSPGKKFFTWGNGEFGDVWQKNLTDKDGPYIEIMTGQYTDNQPDFSWLQPYETKTFNDYWYPLKDMPYLKNANIEGAVSIDIDGTIVKLAFNSTCERKDVHFVLKNKDHVIREGTFDISPEMPFKYDIDLHKEISWDDLFIGLYNSSGKEIISYKKLPKFFEDKQPPKATEAAKDPEQIKTVDELYLNGLHIEQYKHPTYDPDPYYLEGLKRDPGDYRCNNAMGIREYKRANFYLAKEYFQKSINRLIMRNYNPYDGEPYYNLGITLRQLGEDNAALNAFQKASWNYCWRSAAMHQSAEIEARYGNYNLALNYIEICLNTNIWSVKSRDLKSAVLRRLGRFSEALELCKETNSYDKLDYGSRYELYLIQCALNETKKAEDTLENLKFILNGKISSYIGLAADYINAGFYSEAQSVLEKCNNDFPMKHYYLGYIYRIQNSIEKSLNEFEIADRLCMDYCFPNKIIEFTILRSAIKFAPESSRAYYYLGNMYYARGNVDKGIKCWENAKKIDCKIAIVHRNLAIAYFEKRNDVIGAVSEMEKAFKLDGCNSRFLLELLQVYKVAKCSFETRLKLLEDNINLVDERDDLYTQYITLLISTGNVQGAVEKLKNHIFHPYEGGEGILPKLHILSYVILGYKAFRCNRYKEALSIFKKALDYPSNYNEGRKYHAREGHVYYYIASVYESIGDIDNYKACLQKIINETSDIDEAEYFKGLAYRKLGEETEAQKVYMKMIDICENELRSSCRYKYFEAFPVGLPFEQDMRRLNQIKYTVGALYGYVGLGNKNKVTEKYNKLLEITDELPWPKIIVSGMY